MARHQCVGGCGLSCPNKPKRSAPQVTGTYKMPGVPGMGRWLTVEVLPPSNRGRNARGLTGSKRGFGPGTTAKGAKSPQKRQDAARMGRTPYVRLSRMGSFI